MARIPTYQKDTYISDLDRLIGTDGDTNELVTKNFFLGNIAEYVIDKFIDPDAVSFTIPVLRDTQDTLGSNATRITGSIMSQDINPDGTKITIAGDLEVNGTAQIDSLTSGFLPYVNPAGILADSIIYQDAEGHVGVGVVGTPPNPEHKFEVYDLRDENNALDYSMIVSADVNTSGLGAGGIKNQLSLDGGVTYPYAISLVTGTTSSEVMATGKLAFYSNSDLNTASGTGFSGFVTHDGTDTHWQLGGNGTDAAPITTLKVVGTGEFTDQVTIPETPVAGTDAASKAYVDAQVDTCVTGTGTTNTLTLWTDGPNSELGDSIVSELANRVYVAGNLLVGTSNTIPGTNALTSGDNNSVLGNSSVAFGSNNSVSGNRCGGLGANNIVAGGQVWATGDGNNVGIDKLNVGGNIVTAGFNNTVKSGGSCVVGTSNILTNTTESSEINTNFAMGSSNTLNDVADGIALGFNNTINNNDSCVLGKSNTTNAIDTYAIGKSNTLSSEDDYAFGLNNTISGDATIAMALGHNNVLSGSQSYAFGRNLEDGGEDNTVIIGRYNATPTATGRIVFGTGFSPTGRKNAIEIQNGTSSQSGLLFPALRLSNSYNSDSDAAAAGVERGELYRFNNQVRINLDQVVQDARNNEGFAYLTPQLITASAGTSKNVIPNYNLVLLSWTGGNGVFTLNLPLASANTHRLIRITTDGSLDAGAADKINITAVGGETIDGNPSFQISKRYEGLAVFSTGTEWIIVQAKAH
jgi:hypothetical protein